MKRKMPLRPHSSTSVSQEVCVYTLDLDTHTPTHTHWPFEAFPLLAPAPGAGCFGVRWFVAPAKLKSSGDKSECRDDDTCWQGASMDKDRRGTLYGRDGWERLSFAPSSVTPLRARAPLYGLCAKIKQWLLQIKGKAVCKFTLLNVLITSELLWFATLSETTSPRGSFLTRFKHGERFANKKILIEVIRSVWASRIGSRLNQKLCGVLYLLFDSR